MKKKTFLITLAVFNVIFGAEFENHNKSSVSHIIFHILDFYDMLVVLSLLIVITPQI